MQGQTVGKTFQSAWFQGVFVLLAAVYFLVNALRLGGDAFVFNLNNVVAAPLALGVSLIALVRWRQVAFGSQNRLLWSGLMFGWLLWTAAEVWWAVASFRGQEVPYPSGADFFWLLGYLPMYVALWARIRSLPKIAHPFQQVSLWLAGVLSLGWTAVFVFVPMLKNADPTAVIENTLNLVYPLADLILLLLVLRIFFTYQQGMYGQVWSWLVAGFILHSLAGLIFSYAATADLYYPEQQATLLSTIGVDYPYNMAYLLWLVGLFLLGRMQKTYQPILEASISPVLVPNTHLVVFTNTSDTVMDVSQNFSHVFATDTVHGKTLSEVLGIVENEEQSLFRHLKTHQVLKERPILCNTRFGQQQVLLSGISVANPQGEYSGCIFLLRLFTEDDSFDGLLTEYQKGMVRFLLQKTGGREDDEIKQSLTQYYRAFLAGFYNRVLVEGGTIMADALVAELNRVASENQWAVIVQPENLLDTSSLTLEQARQALPVLYETAKQFIANLEDEQVVAQIVQQVSEKFGQTIYKYLAHSESPGQ
jgi:hypothetical protein